MLINLHKTNVGGADAKPAEAAPAAVEGCALDPAPLVASERTRARGARMARPCWGDLGLAPSSSCCHSAQPCPSRCKAQSLEAALNPIQPLNLTQLPQPSRVAPPAQNFRFDCEEPE